MELAQVARMRPYVPSDRAAVLELAIAGFTPIYASFRAILGPELFAAVYPDWKASQTDYLARLCDGDEPGDLWVAANASSGEVQGFVHYSIDVTGHIVEIGINTVSPEHQGRGIGTAMYGHVLGLVARRGVTLVQVATGGDPSHAAARGAYTTAGFRALPLTRFYRLL